jgi:hypothetical protein
MIDDLRYALRMPATPAGFAAVAALSLAPGRRGHGAPQPRHSILAIGGIVAILGILGIFGTFGIP